MSKKTIKEVNTMSKKTMLYKHPGSHDIHGDKFDYIIVEDADIDASVKDGWSLTTVEAVNGKKKAKASNSKDDGPTREEMKEKAKELELEYPKNISNVKLLALIEDKLKSQV